MRSVADKHKVNVSAVPLSNAWPPIVPLLSSHSSFNWITKLQSQRGGGAIVITVLGSKYRGSR